MYDLKITDGQVYLGGALHRVNIYVAGGKIAALSEENLPAADEIGAEGRYVFPGFIDPHVHFHLGVGTNISADDFVSGSRQAALGGVTTYIDFLDPIKKADDIDRAFFDRMALAKGSLTDYAFHTTIANPTDPPEEICQKSLEHGINSIKLFTTYADTDRRTYEAYIYDLLAATRHFGCIAVVHSEADDLIRKGKRISYRNLQKSRPSICERQEVSTLADMARETGGRLYIVHVSAGSTLEMLKTNYMDELLHGNITLESCPHYFLLNEEKLFGNDGYKYTMTPPLRPERDRELMVSDFPLISTIGTDHCPYTKEQKNKKYTSEIPMGIGGIRYSFLNMYSLFGLDCVDRFTSGPARAYGLTGKGALLPGMDADITVFNPDGEETVDDEMSVYNGKTYRGKIETVVSGGKAVVLKGELHDERQGTYIGRGPL